jgi:hypothetical protein
LGRRPKFGLVGLSTTGPGIKYTDTPWTVLLIAAHSWLELDSSRVIGANGREIGYVHSKASEI